MTQTKEYLEITAAADESKHPAVNGIAYSGGKMKLGGWRHPVVVDLAGLAIPASIPLLANHENHTSARIGLVSASLTDGHLAISGEIVAQGEPANAILTQAKSGAAWQLSIGAEVETAELVQEGTRTVNGVSHSAPFYHVQKASLREVSVVAVGADAATNMSVTASFKLTQPMPEPIPTPAPTPVPAPVPVEPVSATADPDAVIKAERERVMRIKALCANEFSDIEAEAISAGWTPEATSEKLLAAYRAKQPKADVTLTLHKSTPDAKATIEAALSLRAGIPEDALTKAFGEQVMEAAYPDRDISLKAVMAECIRAEGQSVPRHFDNTAIQAAFSTLSLPGILSNVANKRLLQSYTAQPIIAQKLCSLGDLNDFKENERFRLTDVGDLQPLAQDGEIKDGRLTEETASNQIDTYAKKFCLTRKMIINDDLGAFLKVPIAMGNRAARLIDQLFFKRLLSNPTWNDGTALFHASHKNLLTGAASALSADSLKKAIQKYLDQVDADGQPISVEPKFLVVPTALKHLAIELTRGTTLISSGSTDVLRPSLNVLADEDLSIVSSPYLAHPNYSGSSGTAWYLFGSPNQVDTFEIGYLKGKRTPTVERGDLDFNSLGIWFRVYFDVGVREQDFRGIVKANGAA